MQIEKLGKKALTNPTIVGISIFKLRTRTNPMIKLLLGLVGIILYWAIRNAMKSHCDGLEKPKDPFVGIPLKFLGVKEEWYHSVRCKITALYPDGPIYIRVLSENESVGSLFSFHSWRRFSTSWNESTVVTWIVQTSGHHQHNVNLQKG